MTDLTKLLRELEQRPDRFTQTERKRILDAAIAALESRVLAENKPIGYAAAMPGTDKGFTMAVFDGATVLVGTPVFTHPTPDDASAKERYDALGCEAEESDPVERLRFFCSLAMNGQDWLDVEPFFDAITRPTPDDASQWISVDDRLPDEGQAVMFVVASKYPDYNGRVFGGSFCMLGGRPSFNTPGVGYFASHWMPTPKPPAAIDAAMQADKEPK